MHLHGHESLPHDVSWALLWGRERCESGFKTAQVATPVPVEMLDSAAIPLDENNVKLLATPIQATLKFQKVLDTFLVTSAVVYTHVGTPGDAPLMIRPDGYAIAVGYQGRGRWVEYAFRFNLGTEVTGIVSYWRGNDLEPFTWTEASPVGSDELADLAEDVELTGGDRTILGRLRAELNTFTTVNSGMWTVWTDVARELATETFHIEHHGELFVPRDLLARADFIEIPEINPMVQPWVRRREEVRDASWLKRPTQRTDELRLVIPEKKVAPWARGNGDDGEEGSSMADGGEWEGSESLEYREVDVLDDEGDLDPELTQDTGEFSTDSPESE